MDQSNDVGGKLLWNESMLCKLRGRCSSGNLPPINRQRNRAQCTCDMEEATIGPCQKQTNVTEQCLMNIDRYKNSDKDEYTGKNNCYQ